MGFVTDRLVFGLWQRLLGRYRMFQMTPWPGSSSTMSPRSFVSPQTGRDTVALEDVGFAIGPGETASLCWGQAVAARRTILNLIAGFAFADFRRGASRRPAGFSKPGPDRGVVFQEASLFHWLTVEDNVAFALKMQKRSARRVSNHAVARTSCAALA